MHTHQQHGRHWSPVQTHKEDRKEDCDPREVDDLVLDHSQADVEDGYGKDHRHTAHNSLRLVCVFVEKL